MNGALFRKARHDAGWTQARLADKLQLTQAYLSLMESGRRPMPARVARRLVRLLDLPPTMLPVTTPSKPRGRPSNAWFEAQLARLDYPGFAYRRRPGSPHHPAEVLLVALAQDDLEPRLTEALPWLLLQHEGMDVQRLVAGAKARDLQNRLGFVVALARQVAERSRGYEGRASELRLLEELLEPSRLAREETFGQGRASERMRAWLRKERTDAARHWNLLTDLKVEHLPYAR
jgi:transcriptional regulator with XRE-family HTH domain